MSLRHTIFVTLLFMTFSAHAFELIMIQAVSSDKRTFVTRNGKRQGVQLGMRGTFTAEDVSVLAKVVSVTGNFTQWELINSDASLPFPKGAVITYYPATEYIWALAPEKERKKYIKSEVVILKNSWLFKGALTRAVSESVSDAPANTPRRGGYLGEVYYERDFLENWAFDVGLRYEQEIINYEGASLTTKRNLFIADVIYYVSQFKDYLGGGRLYFAAGMGYGLSNTKSDAIEQSGVVSMLPAFRGGMSLPFSDEYEFLLDVAFESMQTREEQESGRIQTTTQTNFKTGFGLRKFF